MTCRCDACLTAKQHGSTGSTPIALIVLTVFFAISTFVCGMIILLLLVGAGAMVEENERYEQAYHEAQAVIEQQQQALNSRQYGS